MFKPPRLKARQLRNLRHWGMELIVVAVGVLLALWAQEWVESRREVHQMELAEEAIREELRMNLATVLIHNSADRCQIDMIDGLFTQLEAPGNEWPGITEHAIDRTSSGEGRKRSFYPLPLYEIKTLAWESAINAGSLSGMRRERMEKYLRAYDVFRVVREKISQEMAIKESLSWLMYPAVMTSELRAQARGALKNLDGARSVRTMISPMAADALGDLGIGPSPAMDAVIDGWPEMSSDGNPSIFRPCFKAPENPLSTQSGHDVASRSR